MPPTPEYNTDENINNISNNSNQIVLTTEQLRQILLRIETTGNDILTVERVHTSQFIDIIDKLNDIYNKMSGELSPALTPADSLTRYDEERLAFGQALTVSRPTSSGLAPFAVAISGIGACFSRLVRSDRAFGYGRRMRWSAGSSMGFEKGA